MITHSKKSILFVTRPLSPPWDEASKNFAYDLACNVGDCRVTILTDTVLKNAPQHITQQKIYTQNHFSLMQKLRLIIYLIFHASEFEVIHLLFTPTKLNSWLMQKILHNKNVKIVQTIATVREDLYNTHNLQKMFFGDTLVTYSKWAQDKLQKLHFKNIKQIYPGINLAKYTPGEKDPTLMQKWRIAPSDIIVTYPGEFVRLGATDLIIETLLDLWKDGQNMHIKYICACRIKNAGDERKKQEIVKKITNAGHVDKVIFTNTYGDMNSIYNLSDMIIFPVTNMQGKFDVPLAMIEPYACKKTVIASDLPLFREFSSDAINVIIPTANTQALRDAIINLSQDPDKQKELGENAFIFAHETFNIKNIAQSYGDLYKKL